MPVLLENDPSGSGDRVLSLCVATWFRCLAWVLLATLAACGDPVTNEEDAETAPEDRPVAHRDAGPTSLRFVDITSTSGMNVINHSGRKETKEYLIEAVGPGSAWLDFDHDGFIDLYAPDGDVFSNYRLQKVLDESSGQRVERVVCVRRDNVKEKHRAQLWRNNGDGTFTDVAKSAGVDTPSWSFGVTAFDYNADGWADLFVSNWGHDQLYRNNQDGTFTDVAKSIGVQGPEGGWSTCAAVGDIDKDDDQRLDLYVARYADPAAEIDRVRRKQGLPLSTSAGAIPGRDARWRGMKVYVGPVGLVPQGDVAYRQLADGKYTDATEAWGLVPISHQYGFTVSMFDFNANGLLDMYVANDSVENFLWEQTRNSRGEVVFEERASTLGVKFGRSSVVQASMGLCTTDINQDGEIDYFVTNFSHDYNNIFVGRRMSSGKYYFNDRGPRVMGNQVFNDLAWGCGLEDFDNDADVDLYVANGHVYYDIDNFKDVGSEYRQYNALFECMDAKGLSFREVGTKAQLKPGGLDPADLDAGDGMAVKRCSRQAAFGDFNNDGLMDVVVGNLNDPPTVLLNQARCKVDNHWIKISLEQPGSMNRDALGALIEVETPGGKQYRPVVALNSFLGSNDPRQHFGLGTEATCTVRVRWPGEREFGEVYENIVINKHNRIARGEAKASVLPMKSFEVATKTD